MVIGFMMMYIENKVAQVDMTVSANPSEEMKYRYRNALQILAPKLFPASGDRKQLVEDWEKTTSIVIVRHPLARLGARTPNFRIHPMCKLKCRFQLFVLYLEMLYQTKYR